MDFLRGRFGPIGMVLLVLVLGGAYLGKRFFHHAASQGLPGRSTPTAATSPPAKARALLGQHAIGTAAMRKLGCDPAAVVDWADVKKVVAPALYPRLEQGAVALQAKQLVYCEVAQEGATTCDPLAAAFVPMAQPRERFVVLVKRQGEAQALCTRAFDSRGKPITDL